MNAALQFGFGYGRCEVYTPRTKRFDSIRLVGWFPGGPRAGQSAPALMRDWMLIKSPCWWAERE